MVDVLSTVNPGHRYFNKDYYPSPEELRNVEHLDEFKVTMDNSDGFFDNLPQKKFKGKKKSKIFKSVADQQQPFKFNVKNFKMMKDLLELTETHK